jgi:protein-S-isoprenylcysteine O-methyltransferase Ste14
VSDIASFHLHGVIVLRNILSILILPTTVTVVVPYLILSPRPSGTAAWAVPDPLAPAIASAGVCALAAGLGLVGVTVWHFATIGRGTLAPWDPPRHLVVAGVYRHVRNPMISGVLLILLGETLWFRSAGLLVWTVGFFALNATYIPLVEERGLERRFGDEYREYKRHVPRWVPRMSAWRPPSSR